MRRCWRPPRPAPGAVKFVNFTFSALLGPVSGSRLVQASAGAETKSREELPAGFQSPEVGNILALTQTYQLAVLLRFGVVEGIPC